MRQQDYKDLTIVHHNGASSANGTRCGCTPTYLPTYDHITKFHKDTTKFSKPVLDR